MELNANFRNEFIKQIALQNRSLFQMDIDKGNYKAVLDTIIGQLMAADVTHAIEELIDEGLLDD